MTTAFKRDPNVMHPSVKRYGKSEGLYVPMPKEEVERMCQILEAEHPLRAFDWHYYGGRVHIMSLPVEYLDYETCVYNKLTPDEQKRTSQENVADVLAALERLL